MSDINITKELTKDLTVLCVDDEPLAREYLSLKLKRTFREVFTADDGITGLEAFRQKRPDIIITDNRMIEMDGIEMIMRIREEDSEIPIILTTAYTEKDALVSAINCNVNHFLAKPIDAKLLQKAIDKSLQPIINARLQEKAIKQELELLKYREKYHSQQENNAFKKELSLILNDYFLQKFEVTNTYGENYGVYMNILYRPLDVLSGDIYSIRKLKDGSTFIFLADSMGKGLSASVTSILTTSYMNHIIDTEPDEVTSDISKLIATFSRYIKGILLDDEILSINFIKINFEQEIMEYANFSSPPIYVKTFDNKTKSLRSNNPPLTKYQVSCKIDTYDIKDVCGIMALTDGLYECSTIDNDTVMEKVGDYFATNLMKTDFHHNIAALTKEPEDDVSCIHILKIKDMDENSSNFEITGSLKNVGEAINWVETFLNEKNLDIEDVSMLTLAFTELAMNSFEHSILQLDNKRKYKMISDGEYDAYIASALSEKKIFISIGVKEMLGKKFAYIKILDEGTGFDPHSLKIWMYDKEQIDGKGVKISRRIIDEIYYSADGREAIIIRVIEH